MQKENFEQLFTVEKALASSTHSPPLHQLTFVLDNTVSLTLCCIESPLSTNPSWIAVLRVKQLLLLFQERRCVFVHRKRESTK